MKNLLEMLMGFAFFASVYLAECIPACIGFFLLSLLCGLIIYGMEMNEK